MTEQVSERNLLRLEGAVRGRYGPVMVDAEVTAAVCKELRKLRQQMAALSELRAKLENMEVEHGRTD